jgi:hypothetical protein
MSKPQHPPTIAGVPVDVVLKVGAAIIAGAVWLGILEYRVQQLESHDTYYHGTLKKGQEH